MFPANKIANEIAVSDSLDVLNRLKLLSLGSVPTMAAARQIPNPQIRAKIFLTP
jgi:hypothetical protein